MFHNDSIKTRKIAILSNHAILLQGIISRLDVSQHAYDVDVIDLNQAGVYEKLLKIQPDVVVVDKEDFIHPTRISLSGLIDMLPYLTVVEVNVYSNTIQIIQTQKVKTSSVDDLIKILENPIKLETLAPHSA